MEIKCIRTIHSMRLVVVSEHRNKKLLRDDPQKNVFNNKEEVKLREEWRETSCEAGTGVF